MDTAVHSRKRALVLLNSGFDAYLTIAMIKQLRLLGVGVLIITLTADLVRDENGICLCADTSLSNFTVQSEDRLLIIPGGKSFVVSLLTDPRVFQLLNAINENEGFIFMPAEGERIVNKMDGKRPFTQANFVHLETVEPQIITPDIIRSIQ